MQKCVNYISYIENWKYYDSLNKSYKERTLRLTLSHFNIAWLDVKGQIPICRSNFPEETQYGYIINNNLYYDLIEFVKKNYDLIFKIYPLNDHSRIKYYIIVHRDEKIDISSYYFDNKYYTSLPVELRILHKLLQLFIFDKEIFNSIFWKKNLDQLDQKSDEFIDHSINLKNTLNDVDENYNFEKIIELENNILKNIND